MRLTRYWVSLGDRVAILLVEVNAGWAAVLAAEERWAKARLYTAIDGCAAMLIAEWHIQASGFADSLRIASAGIHARMELLAEPARLARNVEAAKDITR